MIEKLPAGEFINRDVLVTKGRLAKGFVNGKNVLGVESW